MDMELIKKWITRKGTVAGFAIATIGGAFGVVGAPAIYCISAVAGVYIVVQGWIDKEKEKNDSE